MNELVSPVTFKRCPLGQDAREVAYLGDKVVGAVMTINGQQPRAAAHITLPDVAKRWHPARSIEAAREAVQREVADWLDGAGLVPAQRRRA